MLLNSFVGAPGLGIAAENAPSEVRNELYVGSVVPVAVAGAALVVDGAAFVDAGAALVVDGNAYEPLACKPAT